MNELLRITGSPGGLAGMMLLMGLIGATLFVAGRDMSNGTSSRSARRGGRNVPHL